jgi:hypothetical protein
VAAKAKRMPVPQPPQLYKGAESCDFRPDWDAPVDLVPMLEACHAADFDDLTPLLALADLLAERDDPRERWVRLGCDLWTTAAGLKPGRKAWAYDDAKAALGPACETVPGWRLACLWGHLVAWHAPSAYDGVPMGRTWVDARVPVVSRCVWWWAMGFLRSQADAAWSQADAAGSQADAAGSQADAAGSQAYAAVSQAYAAGRQAYAAGSQADAAWSQADAAGSQADAAVRQAYAAGRQAYAAGRQAYAAGRQAYAAGRQKRVWSFARRLWDVCESKLSVVNGWK